MFFHFVEDEKGVMVVDGCNGGKVLEERGERRGLNNPFKQNSLETKNYTRGKSLCCNLLF